MQHCVLEFHALLMRYPDHWQLYLTDIPAMHEFSSKPNVMVLSQWLCGARAYVTDGSVTIVTVV